MCESNFIQAIRTGANDRGSKDILNHNMATETIVVVRCCCCFQQLYQAQCVIIRSVVVVSYFDKPNGSQKRTSLVLLLSFGEAILAFIQQNNKGRITNTNIGFVEDKHEATIEKQHGRLNGFQELTRWQSLLLNEKWARASQPQICDWFE